MRVGIVGINHKLADLKLREELAKACQKWFGLLQAVHDHHYFVLLSTCNRTEIYFSSQDLAETHSYLLGILRGEVEEEFDHKLYSYFGIDCFSHLARVTLGLDSAIIAETEIQGQVKLAYENTSEYHALPADIHFLFQKALGITKKLRSELQLGRGMPNLEHAILQTGKDVFQKPEYKRLLLVGASDINQKILSFLKSKHFQHITVCNRSDDQASIIAKQHHVDQLLWSHLNLWIEYDWIVFGTKSPEYLITQQQIEDCSFGEKLIMDLCVPRNVDPKLGQDPRITLLNIDQINRLLEIRHRRMTHLLAQAEERVVKATQAHASRYTAKHHAKISILEVTA
ncbi:MAG: glutamyl-tRNA reductase [Parachlamydiaceae bacterium]